MSIYGPPPRKPVSARTTGVKRVVRMLAGIAILTVVAMVAVHALLDFERATATERLQIETAESIRLDMEQMRLDSHQQILELMPPVPMPPILDTPLPLQSADILTNPVQPPKREPLQTADILH